jgi:hypothetical protein
MMGDNVMHEGLEDREKVMCANKLRQTTPFFFLVAKLNTYSNRKK